ncbi:MAG: hypothetical protein ACPGJI_07605 [Kangiellaceae bacterium]
MKNSVFYSIITISTLFIGYLIFIKNDHQTLKQEELQQLSKNFGKKFAEMREAQQQTQKPNTQTNNISTPSIDIEDDENTQSIIGIIYKKEKSTWFIKAKDNQKRINQISDEFTQYFLTNLKFDDDQQPIFTHLPEGSKTTSSSAMRYATFMLDGVEVSVINLPGQQDIFSNIKRWMGQVGLDDSSPISMKFLDNKNTIFVKMPK